MTLNTEPIRRDDDVDGKSTVRLRDEDSVEIATEHGHLNISVKLFRWIVLTAGPAILADHLNHHRLEATRCKTTATGSTSSATPTQSSPPPSTSSTDE
jgi:hypothetical protein